MQTYKCERLRSCEHKFDTPGQTIYHHDDLNTNSVSAAYT